MAVTTGSRWCLRTQQCFIISEGPDATWSLWWALLPHVCHRRERHGPRLVQGASDQDPSGSQTNNTPACYICQKCVED